MKINVRWPTKTSVRVSERIKIFLMQEFSSYFKPLKSFKNYYIIIIFNFILF